MQGCAGLVDKRAYLQVLGCLSKEPTLLDDIDRPLDRSDFDTEDFFELLYVAIYNLHAQGCEVIDEFSVDSYLSGFEEQYNIFQLNNGLEYFADARDMAELSNYDYNYHIVRKYSLLRYYEKKGWDTRSIYDSTVSDTKLSEKEKQKFDEYTEQDIVDIAENVLVLDARRKYCSDMLTQDIQAGSGMKELIQSLIESPDYGYSLTSEGLNTVCRGARKGKFYLRSACTSTGKTRNFLMDACNFAVPYTYDLEQKKFIYTGHNVPTLFVGTEGSLEEFQTIVLATISGVNESHILKGKYESGELERVEQAAQYIEESPLYLVYCDDYSISDIENIAKRYVLTRNIEIFIFDYLQTSLRLMTEVSGKSAVKMQEYQILIVFATRMKALAERLNICIISGTQLSAEATDARYKNHLVLQGSKAIAQKVDIGLIISKPNNVEKKKLEAITKHQIACPEINLLQWCYKVRRGELSSIIICSHIDLGTMRIKDCFVTDFDFNLIDIDFTQTEKMEQAIAENSKDIRNEDFEDPEESEKKEEEPAKKEKTFDW